MLPTRICPLLMALLFAVWLPASLAAVETVELSPDITVSIGGETLAPDETGQDDLAGTVTFAGAGVALPVGTNLTGLHRTQGGDTLFAVDTTVALAGGVTASPRDVVRVSGGTPSIEYDGDAAGVPAGTRIDALSSETDGGLLLSFDVTVALGGTTFADEDVVRIDPVTGDESLRFAAAAVGVDPALDLDAVDSLVTGNLIVSFDGTGSAGGITFADEDLVEVDPVAETLALVYDGSAQHAALGNADLDAADAEADSDGDGVLDRDDNCALVDNPGQEDANDFEDDDSSVPGVQHYGDVCDADLDEDGLVAASDFFGVFRPCLDADLVSEPDCAEADFDGDGLVAASDFFTVFRPSLGQSPGPGVTE